MIILDRYYNITDYIKQKKNIISKNGVNLIFQLMINIQKKSFNQEEIKNLLASQYIINQLIFIWEKILFLIIILKKTKKYLLKISNDLEESFNNQNILIAYICVKLLKLPEKTFLD